MTQNLTAVELRDLLVNWIAEEVARFGTSEVINPGHRKDWHWPPRAISLDYHIAGDRFNEPRTIVIDGQETTALLAFTDEGIFGRVPGMWHEAKGTEESAVLDALVADAAPLIERQRAIGRLLGTDGRFTQPIASLDSLGLLRLLFAPDRSISYEAGIEMEARGDSSRFGPAMVAILEDESHPLRRAAQWQVLDLLEDIPTFCPTPESAAEAVRAIGGLIRRAPDDTCRVVYKAGVVLGGHICTHQAADELLASFQAQHRVGRRSAYHASFHLAEWLPERRSEIVQLLREASESDPEPVLREYCRCMARDVEAEDLDHVSDPEFPNEN